MPIISELRPYHLYNVYDRVIVRHDISTVRSIFKTHMGAGSVGITREMEHFAGCEVEISKVVKGEHDNWYRYVCVETGGWYWTDEMFEPMEEVEIDFDSAEDIL